MEQAAKSAVDPETERRVLGDQSDDAGYHGQLKKSWEFRQQAVESARRNDLPETAATYLAAAAVQRVRLWGFR